MMITKTTRLRNYSASNIESSGLLTLSTMSYTSNQPVVGYYKIVTPPNSFVPCEVAIT